VRGPTREIVAAIEKVDGVTAVHRRPPSADESYGGYEIEAEQGVDVRTDLATAVVTGGWGLLRLESVGMSLEEIFLRLTTSEEASQTVAGTTNGVKES